MKHSPNWLPIYPLPMIPVVIITLLILFEQRSHGQTLARNGIAISNKESSGQAVTMLDESRLINSGFTTFFGYSLEGTSRSATIQIVDGKGNLVKEFTVEPDKNGSIILPADLLHEGNYQMQMIVDGNQKCTRDLRVVR